MHKKNITFSKAKLIIALICCNISMTSCSTLFYGFETEASYTKILDVTCTNPSGKIDLFFIGEKTDFEYTKLGFIEVFGGNYDNRNDDILEKLKESAKYKCGDAIIAIESGYTDREEGFLFGNDEDIETYRSKFYKGIVVQYK